jgi:hypothetical protein
LSPLTVSTKLAQIAKQSEHEGVLMGSNSHVALGTRYPQGLWSGLSGPSLTNRMSQLLTYGSVGGVGRKPGPYPAAKPARATLFQFQPLDRGLAEPQRSPGVRARHSAFGMREWCP